MRDGWDAQIVQALLNGAHQHPAELAWFVDDALTFTPKRVLEIGSEAGGSLWLWCQIAADDAQLLAVDNDSQPWLFRGLKERYPWPSRDGQTLRLVEADSRSDEAREAVADFFDGPIDLLFIDGGHFAEIVNSDWDTFSPLVREGGIVALHDVASGPTLGVTALWERLRGEYRTAERVEPESTQGIGVVYV